MSLQDGLQAHRAVTLTLPWRFNRFAIDPAYGSGPLATVIQDLLPLVIYLVIATAMPR